MKNYRLLVSHCHSIVRGVVLAVALTVCQGLSAQTISISPQTGNVIAAASYDDESHLEGYGGAWVHNQLPLTLVVSDAATLTENGLMKTHANNISPNGTSMVVVAGSSLSIHNHMSLSLPKGYRFTSYKMVLAYNSGDKCTFKEMDATFTTANKSVEINSGTTEATLARTSMTDNDMTNVLYFKQQHYTDRKNSYVTIKSFVVTFECTEAFTEALAPGSSATYGTDCVALPFATQRADLGQIKRQTVKGYTSYKYNYTNVRDLHANFMLYDASGVSAGTAVEGQTGNGHIVAASKQQDGKTYMALANDTYWLEVPTDALSQDGKTLIPVGYRIVGARLVCSAYTTSYAAPALGQDIYIMDNTGRYLNASLNYTTTPVAWHTDADGYVWTGNNTYLRSAWRLSTSLSTTTSKNWASTYQIDGRGLYTGTYYVGYSADGKGTYDGTTATIIGTTTVTTGTSSYTVNLYDKTGNNIAATAVVNEQNPTQTISVDGLNNDAVKFAVDGLADGQTAHVALEVQLEALNPYIDKVNVACRQEDGSTTLANQYLADDFTFGTNGQIDFSVPANFASDKMTFAFEQLHSKYADDSYGPLSADGNARYHFVRSAYYDLIGENLQAHRADAADHDYADKVSLTLAGDKAFRCNNSDNYSTSAEGDLTFVFEEYRYANDTYASQGGQWSAVQLASGENRQCYLVTCDETRYNIAPTTTSRHAFYAYYATRISLKTVDYKPVLTYTNVYNDGVTPAGYDANSYVGATVSLLDEAGQPLADGTGYVYAKQIIDQIAADIAASKTNAPVDAKHILYFDASKINSLLFSADNGEWGNLNDLKDQLGVNAMVFLPAGVTATLDNVASKSMSGDDFIAENNIVLTDQYPFFSPYDIRVNAANEVSYKRLVAQNNNTKKWVSLVLPFTVAVDSETGKYIKGSDNSEFTFYQLNESNAFSRNKTNDDLTVVDVDAHFSPYTGADVTMPNAAYIVRIDQAEASDDDSKLMFIVRQSGATIVKTPVTVDAPAIVGETSEGSVDGAAVTLTSQSTYSGVQVPKSAGVFYFNKDKFVSSANLDERYTTVKVLPFRSYYTCNSGALKVHAISISTEPNGEASAIAPTVADGAADFCLSSQAGQLTVVASHDVKVSVRNISGQTVAVSALQAGQSCTLPLASGIYVVNGTKVMVR